jgi:hypothetical protein
MGRGGSVGLQVVSKSNPQDQKAMGRSATDGGRWTAQRLKSQNGNEMKAEALAKKKNSQVHGILADNGSKHITALFSGMA